MEFKVLLLCVSALCLSAATPLQDSCGLRPLVGPPGGSRIVGGREAPEGAWPWQVSVQVWSKHLCGGTIISSLRVLTASHCFDHKLFKLLIRTRDLRVVAGLHVKSAPGVQTQTRSIREVKRHQDYNANTGDSDVTLLLLSSPFNFTDHIQPVCTPRSVTHEVHLNFNHCFITGWGSTSFGGKRSDRLQEAEVELFDRRTCNQITWYNGRITENMICAGLASGAVDACGGDSGGPLQCYSEDEDRFYVVGVTSFGDKCGLPRRPGVYARTSRFAGWLWGQISSAAPRITTRLSVGLLSAALMLL